MKLSSRSRYAISAMLELALHGDKSETPIVDMARKYNISQSSMEQLFARLRAASLVTGRRGRRGGYRLARPAQAITIAEIIASVDDEKLTPSKAEGNDVAGTRRRVADSVWDSLSRKLYEFLGEITLADVMEKGGEFGVGSEGGERASGTGEGSKTAAGSSRVHA